MLVFSGDNKVNSELELFSEEGDPSFAESLHELKKIVAMPAIKMQEK
jgi:diaminopimelate decarboxylase